jgi:hypothetical protein
MELNAEQYFQAGLERMRQARLLYQAADSFALCMYTAGLAVECVLRAFRWRKDPSFSGRHDLMELFAASGILPTYETHMRARGADPGEIDQEALELHAAMQVMAVRWANSFRFASEARLRARLKEMGLYRGKKGDVLKANSLALLGAAQAILDKGVFLWTSGKR